MRSRSLALIILTSTALAGCATFNPPQISYDDERPAVLEGEPPKPVQVVEIAKPLPLPGQLKPLRGVRSAPSRAIRVSGSTKLTPPLASSQAAVATSMPCRSIHSPTAPSTKSMPLLDR